MPDITTIVKRLNSRYVGERLEAERTLEQMGPEAVEALLQLIIRESDNQHFRRRLYFCIATGYGAVAFVVVAAIHAAGPGDYGVLGDGLSAALGGILGGGGGTLLGGFAWLLAPSRLQLLALNVLAKFDDVRVVGPLAEALKSRDANLRATAGIQLVRLLPRLQVGDAGLLTEHQREGLHSVLKMRHAEKEKELVLAVLVALEQIGTVRALPYVQGLARAEANTPDERAVRDAAQACLPRLEERIQWLRGSETLVRPATAPDAPSEVLLRPARGVSESDSSLLLRPSTSEE